MMVVPNTRAIACGFSKQAKSAAVEAQNAAASAANRIGRNLKDPVRSLPKSTTHASETSDNTFISRFELSVARAVWNGAPAQRTSSAFFTAKSATRASSGVISVSTEIHSPHGAEDSSTQSVNSRNGSFLGDKTGGTGENSLAAAASRTAANSPRSSCLRADLERKQQAYGSRTLSRRIRDPTGGKSTPSDSSLARAASGDSAFTRNFAEVAIAEAASCNPVPAASPKSARRFDSIPFRDVDRSDTPAVTIKAANATRRSNLNRPAMKSRNFTSTAISQDDRRF